MGFIKSRGILPYSEAEIENMFVKWDALRNVGKLETWPQYHELSADFPYLCLTNFSGVQTVEDYPDLVAYNRAYKAEVGPDTSFAGTSGTNQFTPTSQQFVDALWESIQHFSGVTYYLTIGGVEHEVTSVNKTTRVISLGSTPTGTSCEIYPYRIAGSTTTARVFSLQGLGLIGLGDADRYFVGGLARRARTEDLFAGLSSAGPSVNTSSISTPTWTRSFFYGVTRTASSASETSGLLVGTMDNGTKTHGPTWSVHIYQHVGRV